MPRIVRLLKIEALLPVAVNSIKRASVVKFFESGVCAMANTTELSVVWNEKEAERSNEELDDVVAVPSTEVTFGLKSALPKGRIVPLTFPVTLPPSI